MLNSCLIGQRIWKRCRGLSPWLSMLVFRLWTTETLSQGYVPQRPCPLRPARLLCSHQSVFRAGLSGWHWCCDLRSPRALPFPSLLGNTDFPGHCWAEAGPPGVPLLSCSYFTVAWAQCSPVVPSDPSVALSSIPLTPSQPSPNRCLQPWGSGLYGTPEIQIYSTQNDS